MRTRTIKNNVLFELSMKGLTLLLISPLLNACIQAYLGSRGSQVDLFQAFLSLLAALCCLTAIFFEIAVTGLMGLFKSRGAHP